EAWRASDLHASRRRDRSSVPLATADTAVSQGYAYSAVYDPPAPVLPVQVLAPTGRGDGVALAALVDTGADVSALPESVARVIGLPRVDRVPVSGVTGRVEADVYAAMLVVAGRRYVARIVAVGAEAILGRDVINRFASVLDGPRRRLEVHTTRSHTK